MDDIGEVVDKATIGNIAPSSSGNIPTQEISSNPIFSDYWGRQRTPDKFGLIAQFKRHVYSCATLNANTFAIQKPRLYVKTNATQRAPRVPTKSISVKQTDYLQDNYGEHQFFKDFAKIEEVLRHPILDLFRTVNDTGLMQEYQLFRDTQLYLEIVGTAYWYLDIEGSIFGRPTSIYLLPSQYVTPKREINSKNYVDYYEYSSGNGNPIKFSPEDIVSFRMPDLRNPFTGGISPEQAAWEDILIEAKLLGHLTGTLDNQARPDALVTPNEPLGTDEAEFWEQRLNRKFNRGKSGGIQVTSEPMKFTPLNWPLSDFARLDIQKHAKLAIANCYQTPIALIESQSINRATLEAAQIQHGRYCIRPRHKNVASVLNSSQFVDRWDSSGRLFLAFDDPVPEDEDIKVKKMVALVTAGIITPNEAREEYKLPPHSEGNKLQSKSNGSQERQAKRDSAQSEK